MPEYGFFENAKHLSDPVPDTPTFDLHAFNEREREKTQRESDSQEAIIEMERRTAEYLRQNENKLLELRRIADAAEQRAKLAEQESASARKDARFSKTTSVLALLVSMGSLVVAALSFIFR